MSPGKTNAITIVVAALACVIALALWFGWFFYQEALFKLSGYSLSSAERGQWGDAFGALNALFAAFAFISVVFTLVWQQKQIRMSQIDQHKQRFESSYFELLRLLDDARKSVYFRHSKDYVDYDTGSAVKSSIAARANIRGTRAFRAIWNEALYWIDLEGKHPSKEVVAATYIIRIHARNESIASPYFRLIYTILNRIKRDPILSKTEKIGYANLLRSRLTSFELAVCAINGLSEISNDFDKLLIEFRFLKYLPPGQRRSFLQGYYPPETFLGRED